MYLFFGLRRFFIVLINHMIPKMQYNSPSFPLLPILATYILVCEKQISKLLNLYASLDHKLRKLVWRIVLDTLGILSEVFALS